MNLKKIAPLAVTCSLLTAGLAAPTVASAEVSANVAVSNMYLWRGVNLSPDGGVVSGGLDYANESGFYAGVWTSSEEGGHETDVYLGFSGEAGDISYDVGYIYYMYPEDGGPALSITDEGAGDFAEVYLSGGMAGFGASVAISTETINEGDSDWIYYTLDYTTGKYNILYGAWSYDKSGNEEYSHVTLTYSYNDNLSFAVSLAQEDTTNGVEEDPLFAVTYSIPLAE